MAPSGGHRHGQSEGRSAHSASLEDIMRRRGVMEAWDCFEDMQRQGIFIDRFTVSRMLIKTAGDSHTRWNSAKVYRGITLVEQFISNHPSQADEVLFNALLDTCCRLKDLARLEATMQRMRDLQIYPSHVTLGILVKAYGQGGDVTRVLRVWDEMAEQRQQANAVTYGCMIDACVRCGHVQKAVEIFLEMKQQRRHRNTILYTMLIKGYGLDKNLQAALGLFREMKEEGVPYNTITYNSIIDVCIKCSDNRTAEELMNEMLLPGSAVEPDLITFSTLLKGYCHIGNLNKALNVAEAIKERNLRCDELVYNTLMDGCVKANDLFTGIGIFTEMTNMGFRPSSITHSILIRLYQRNGYKGNAYEAVAQLYQHHGLERPTAVSERGSKASGTGRRGERQRGQNSGVRGGGGRAQQPAQGTVPEQPHGMVQPLPPGIWAGAEQTMPMAAAVPYPSTDATRAHVAPQVMYTDESVDVLSGLYSAAHAQAAAAMAQVACGSSGPLPMQAPLGAGRPVPTGRARRGAPRAPWAEQQVAWPGQLPQQGPPHQRFHEHQELEQALEHQLHQGMHGQEAVWPSTDDEHHERGDRPEEAPR